MEYASFFVARFNGLVWLPPALAGGNPFGRLKPAIERGGHLTSPRAIPMPNSIGTADGLSERNT